MIRNETTPNDLYRLALRQNNVFTEKGFTAFEALVKAVLEASPACSLTFCKQMEDKVYTIAEEDDGFWFADTDSQQPVYTISPLITGEVPEDSHTGDIMTVCSSKTEARKAVLQLMEHLQNWEDELILQILPCQLNQPLSETDILNVFQTFTYKNGEPVL